MVLELDEAVSVGASHGRARRGALADVRTRRVTCNLDLPNDRRKLDVLQGHLGRLALGTAFDDGALDELLQPASHVFN